MAPGFKLQLSMLRLEDGGPVFQKQDGDRFDQNITVKLNENCKYIVIFTTRPAKVIKSVLLRGEKLSLTVDAQAGEAAERRVHRAEWATLGIPRTAPRARTYLPCVLQTDAGTVTLTLQAKLYPEAETSHSRWGKEFHVLDATCEVVKGTSEIKVSKLEFM